MPAPTPTEEQKAAIQRELIKLNAQKDAQEQVEANKLARVAELTKIDNAFKAQFDYYNDDIITQYDLERKALDGNFIANPITETDLTDVVNLTGRLLPTPPATDIVRIAEFDGTPLIVEPDNETQNIADQANIETALQSGYGGTTPTFTATSLTDSALTSASTTLDMLDAAGPMSFTAGDVFVVHDGGTDAAVVQVDTAVDNMGGDPPYDWSLTITLLLPPSGTIASGASIIAPFNGFTDGERSSKTAADPNLQPVMNALIASLESEINSRIANLVTQISAIDANLDDDGVSDLATAKTNAQTSSSFLTSYLISTDISDTGLSSLATERGTRSTQISTRVAEIIAAYTGQTVNYYDTRYNTANSRANLATGYLRRKILATKVANQVSDDQTSLQSTINLLNTLI